MYQVLYLPKDERTSEEKKLLADNPLWIVCHPLWTINKLARVRTEDELTLEEEKLLADNPLWLICSPLLVPQPKRKYQKTEVQKLKESVPQPKQKRRKYQKTEVQKLKESVSVNTICCQCLSSYLLFCLLNLTFIC